MSSRMIFQVRTLGALAFAVAIAVAATLLLNVSAARVHGDEISLADGRTIEGTLQRQDGKYLITPAHGEPFTVGLNQVSSITLGPSPASPAYAHQVWQAVLANLKRTDDAGHAIAIIKAYQKKFPQSPDSAQAQSSLTEYQHIERQGLVKYAGKWVTPLQRQTLQRQIGRDVAAAEATLRAGDLQSASTKVQSVLKLDASDVGALVVGGVADYRMNHLPQSARLLGKAVKLAPNNAVAWNDLAVVSFEQRQQPQALNYYTKAINLASGNRLLLDNVAAALHFYNHDRNTFLYKNLRHTFAQADTQMQLRLARQGLYRYGDTWITRSQHARLAGVHSQYETQKLTLEAQYAGATTRLASVTKEISDANDRINQITAEIVNLELAQQALLAQTGAINITNQAILQADIAQLNHEKAVLAQLTNDRNNLIAAIGQMKVQAANMIKNPPHTGYVGLQQMMLPGDLSNPPPPLPLLMPAKNARVQAGPLRAKKNGAAPLIHGMGMNEGPLETTPAAYGIYDQPIYFGSYVFLGYPFIYFPAQCGGHRWPKTGTIDFHNPFSPGVIQNGGPGVIQNGGPGQVQPKTNAYH
ncbi:MAG: hypothetical protein HKL96_00395 [Phycisphaerales bacterium]|nr:hypothetical protein [Phycisphaerales bacterium]